MSVYGGNRLLESYREGDHLLSNLFYVDFKDIDKRERINKSISTVSGISLFNIDYDSLLSGHNLISRVTNNGEVYFGFQERVGGFPVITALCEWFKSFYDMQSRVIVDVGNISKVIDISLISNLRVDSVIDLKGESDRSSWVKRSQNQYKYMKNDVKYVNPVIEYGDLLGNKFFGALAGEIVSEAFALTSRIPWYQDFTFNQQKASVVDFIKRFFPVGEGSGYVDWAYPGQKLREELVSDFENEADQIAGVSRVGNVGATNVISALQRALSKVVPLVVCLNWSMKLEHVRDSMVRENMSSYLQYYHTPSELDKQYPLQVPSNTLREYTDNIGKYLNILSLRLKGCKLKECMLGNLDYASGDPVPIKVSVVYDTLEVYTQMKEESKERIL